MIYKFSLTLQMSLEPLTKININILNNSKMVKRNLTRSSKNDMKKMKFDLEKEQSAQPSEATPEEVSSVKSAYAKAIVVVTSPMEEQSTPVDVLSITAVDTKAKVVDTSPTEEQSTLYASESVEDTAVDTQAKVIDTSPMEEQSTLGGSEQVEGPLYIHIPPQEDATQPPPYTSATDPDNISNLPMMNSNKGFYLSRNVWMELCTFRGEERVDIRQRDANDHRTKIGIALTLPRFKTLMMYINELEAALASAVKGEEIVYEKHIGGNLYVYVKSQFECVQIRQKYIKDGELRYSKYNGISLKSDQFKSFTLLTEMMESFHP